MKDCSYYSEQLMLKYFNEDYDIETDRHLLECNKCMKEYNDLKQVFNNNTVSELKKEYLKKRVHSKITKNSFFKWFYSTAVAASLLILLFINFSSETNEKKINGGEEIKFSFEEFNSLEENLSDLSDSIDEFESEFDFSI